jgi:hypothetical protein
MADIYYCDAPPNHEWMNIQFLEECDEPPQNAIDDWVAEVDRKWFPVEDDAGVAAPAATTETVEKQFLRLADEWSRETGHVSSASDLISDTRYQQIIRLGWPAIPYMLNDLERNRRFWFPALAAITGLRPFDRGDASNYQRMTDAWLRWGRRKGLI